MKEVKFRNQKYLVSTTATYSNGRVAIQLLDKENGEPASTASVNLPSETLNINHVFIKTWSENEGVYESLLEAGIIEPVIRKVQTGYVQAFECKLIKE